MFIVGARVGLVSVSIVWLFRRFRFWEMGYGVFVGLFCWGYDDRFYFCGREGVRFSGGFYCVLFWVKI